MTLKQTFSTLLLILSLPSIKPDDQTCASPETAGCAVIKCGSVGKDGAPGTDGQKGDQGDQGISGTQGDPGPPGPQGVQGPQGPKGDQGDSLGLDAIKSQLTDMDGRLTSLQAIAASQKNALLFNRGTSVGNKMFVTNGLQATFNNAKATCNNAGGQLASPRSSDENQAVLAIVLKYRKNAFLGINDLQGEGTYVYSTGEAIGYTNWDHGEPNNIGNESCVEMYSTGTWNDKSCGDNRLVICEFQ